MSIECIQEDLKKLGYYKIKWGLSCGRNWIEIDGKVICQTQGDDVYLRDEDVSEIIKVVLK